MSKTLDQKTNAVGFPKAAEIIEITGAHELEAPDRATFNILYQHAHDSGQLGEPGAKFKIELAKIRPSKHESNDRIRECFSRLLKVNVNVPFVDPDTDELKVLQTPLFAYFVTPAKSGTSTAFVEYGIPEKLAPILERSQRWGRIKAEIVCAMTSRYSQALYEMIQLRANLDRCVESFPIDRFRELMNVPPGTYERGNDFIKRVIEVAALEVNGLSDMGVTLEAVRKSPKSPITSVTVAWWRKEGDEFRAALQERQRSKVGRMARLRGTVESTEI